jgi:hypothetical protein
MRRAQHVRATWRNSMRAPMPAEGAVAIVSAVVEGDTGATNGTVWLAPHTPERTRSRAAACDGLKPFAVDRSLSEERYHPRRHSRPLALGRYFKRSNAPLSGAFLSRGVMPQPEVAAVSRGRPWYANREGWPARLIPFQPLIQAYRRIHLVLDVEAIP